MAISWISLKMILIQNSLKSLVAVLNKGTGTLRSLIFMSHSCMFIYTTFAFRVKSRVLSGGFISWVCGWNPKMWPLNWNLCRSTCIVALIVLSTYLFFNILRSKIWKKNCWILDLVMAGNEWANTGINNYWWGCRKFMAYTVIVFRDGN